MIVDGRRRGRRPDPARRGAVLAVAKQAFFEKGFDATGIREIADRLGITSGTLYHHVSSKEELLFEIVQDVYTRSLALLQRVQSAQGEPLEKLERLMRGHVENVTRDVVTTTLALNDYKSLSPSHQRVIDEEHRIYLSGFVTLIEEAQHLARVKDDLDPELMTLAVVGCLNSIVGWYRSPASRPPEHVASTFVRLLLDGMAVDP
jgi:AcrR family transcriptional regulator